MIRRERDQLLTSVKEERISCDQEPCGLPCDQCPKRIIKFALAARIQDQNLSADAVSPLLQVLGLLFGVLGLWVD
jgi:hypothetical protein